MLSKLVEGLLPGLREFRVPLLSGVLWSLFLWLVLAQPIEDTRPQPAFLAQVSDAAETFGPATTLAVATLVAFVVGCLAATVVEPLAAVAGSLLGRARAWFQWNQHARTSRSGLVREIDRLNLMTATEPDAGPDIKRQREEHIETARRRLSLLTPKRWLGWLPMRRTQNRVEAAGAHHSSQTLFTRCSTLAQDAWDAGVDAELSRSSNGDTPEIPRGDALYHAVELRAEIERAPLDVLRALDELRYQEFDRERSERDLRMSIALPLAAVSIWAAIDVTPWAVVGLVLAVATFLRNAAQRADLSLRVLDHVAMKNLRTPALLAAERAGRLAVRRAWRDHLKEQTTPPHVL